MKKYIQLIKDHKNGLIICVILMLLIIILLLLVKNINLTSVVEANSNIINSKKNLEFYKVKRINTKNKIEKLNKIKLQLDTDVSILEQKIRCEQHNLTLSWGIDCSKQYNGF